MYLTIVRDQYIWTVILCFCPRIPNTQTFIKYIIYIHSLSLFKVVNIIPSTLVLTRWKKKPLLGCYSHSTPQNRTERASAATMTLIARHKAREMCGPAHTMCEWYLRANRMCAPNQQASHFIEYYGIPRDPGDGSCCSTYSCRSIQLNFPQPNPPTWMCGHLPSDGVPE